MDQFYSIFDLKTQSMKINFCKYNKNKKSSHECRRREKNVFKNDFLVLSISNFVFKNFSCFLAAVTLVDNILISFFS